jgi:DMSO/TMAO reductase YedYZ molybdopterin-dependent catalytic subunit
VTTDIHCVTKWSKLDTVWEGVSVDTLLAEAVARGVESAPYVLAVCDGGYTTNLPLADVTRGKAWVAVSYNGAPLAPEHGGPARLLVPHLLLLEEREVGAAAASHGARQRGILGVVRLSQLR